MIINDDILNWCKEYKGEKFHALLCDPPYHLTSISSRFGGEDSHNTPAMNTEGFGHYARLAKGFMGQKWDGGDIAFRKETWVALSEHLHDGAFIMAFASSRGFHKMALAMEDAGLIMHPFIGWVYGSGFPKATRLKENDIFSGHRYGLQALKPALEPILVFQKPYVGRSVDNIVATGAGMLNIDGGRLDSHAKKWEEPRGGIWQTKPDETSNIIDNPLGRWPSNLVLSHTPECKKVGVKQVGDGKEGGYSYQGEEYQVEGFVKSCKPDAQSNRGTETIENWECPDCCPIRRLGEQSGERAGWQGQHHNTFNPYGGNSLLSSETSREGYFPGYQDEGTASRFFFNANWNLENADPFFYCPKASRGERDEGLERFPTGETQRWNKGGEWTDDTTPAKNSHPTVKPISLTKHLASLLLPPKEYAPRRILVPFAGVGSEMIGCLLADWEEIVGIEMETDYVQIAEARFEYWKNKPKQYVMDLGL